MTTVYTDSSDVIVTITLPVYAGVPLIPSVVTRTVKDETGAIISAAAPVTVPGGLVSTMDIVIPAALNVIAGRRAARVIDVEFTTAKGTYAAQSIYLIETPDQLVFLTNSFVTAAEALMTRRDMPTLDGWDAAVEGDRVAALITAHSRLCRMTYRYKSNASVTQSRVTWGEPEDEGFTYIVDIETLTAEEWVVIPLIVRQAFQRAQMAEADTHLRGDPIGDKRRAGILSEKTGESAMSFGSTPEVRMAVSREALDYLSGYVFRSTRIARA